MMHISRRLFFSICTAALLTSCFKDPEFPDTPRIEFAGLRYVHLPSSGGNFRQDSLILTINFEDGNGDLGLEDSDNQGKFSPLYYFDSINGNQETFVTSTSIRYGHLNENKQVVKTTTNDTLPDYNTFRCLNYTNQKVNGIETIFYTQKNKFHNNIFVDFLIKNEDGTFKKHVWETANLTSCSNSFDGRFPLLKEDIDRESPLEGSLSYTMLFFDFKEYVPFKGKTIKLRASIVDRELNISNSVESQEFNFSNF